MLDKKASGEARLRQKLGMERQMMPLIEREMLAHADDIVCERENWFDACVDYGHKVSFDNARTAIFRGVARRDESLFWLMRRDGKRFGYHAAQDDPLAAMEEADAACRGRRAVRENRDFVEALARDLLAGRRTFRVQVDDALSSPLCPMGV